MGAFLRLNYLTSQRIKRESTDGKEFIKVPADFPLDGPSISFPATGAAPVEYSDLLLGWSRRSSLIDGFPRSAASSPNLCRLHA